MKLCPISNTILELFSIRNIILEFIQGLRLPQVLLESTLVVALGTTTEVF